MPNVKLYNLFNSKYASSSAITDAHGEFFPPTQTVDEPVTYADQLKQNNKVTSAALILHDIGTKIRKHLWPF